MPASDRLGKRIWFFWLQGIHNAPDLVQKCHYSWNLRNPDWEVVSLCADNLSSYLDPEIVDPKTVRPQALSDLLRINLLRKHGGVWVDASCFCIQPLDDWLGQYLDRGFFAFANPGIDRLVSSWFLASDGGSYITSRWADAANRYWSSPNAPTRLVQNRLAKWATVSWPEIWFTKPMREWFRLYPYYWFHYLFRHLYEQDERFRSSWDATPKFAADVPHAALRHGLSNTIDDALRRDVDQRRSPLYKLNWRVEERKVQHDSVLHYLYQTL